MNEENVMNILHSNREKLEKYKKVIRLAIAIVTTMICVCGIYYLYMNRHVKFQDKNMAYEISRTIGPNVNPENVKYKDVYRYLLVCILFLVVFHLQNYAE